jgi:hypothetical protein
MSAPEAGTDRLARLGSLRDDIVGAYGAWGTNELRDACTAAADVPVPGGDPARLRRMADDCAKAHAVAMEAFRAVEELRGRDFGQVWAGDTHIAAAAALTGLANTLSKVYVVGEMATRLHEHADVVEAADRTDRSTADSLRVQAARADAMTLGWFPDPSSYEGAVMRDAHQTAMADVRGRIDAHTAVRDAAHTFSSGAYDAASGTVAARLGDSPLSALDEVVIGEAETAVPGGPLILTAAMADRAADAMAGLSDTDRRRVTELLAGAQSAQQRAYLMKTLAAGYRVDEVSRFDALIAPHGADPAWLREHLSPLSGPGGHVTFQGAPWTQGNDPTCVAASTVAARAQVDPLYALGLTTGGHPGDPTHDNPAVFTDRLRAEQHAVYDDERTWWQDVTREPAGLNAGQSENIANEQLAPRTGVSYENRDIDGPEARRAALGEIEHAVDEGYPVPFETHEGPRGHQMIIIGHP